MIRLVLLIPFRLQTEFPIEGLNDFINWERYWIMSEFAE